MYVSRDYRLEGLEAQETKEQMVIHVGQDLRVPRDSQGDMSTTRHQETTRGLCSEPDQDHEYRRMGVMLGRSGKRDGQS